MKHKTLKVTIDRSTWRWLKAMADAHNRIEGNLPVTPQELISEAAFALADGAGRRTGSWEGDAGRRLIEGSGWSLPTFARIEQLHRQDDIDSAREREEWNKAMEDERREQGEKDRESEGLSAWNRLIASNKLMRKNNKSARRAKNA